MQPHFLKLKSNLELDPTFADSIATRHSAIRTYLQNNLADFRDSKLIGSLQRKTRIHPGPSRVFDIDILVVMGAFDHWVAHGGITAHDALGQLHMTVHDSVRYGNMNPAVDPPTVTLTYGDNVEVQLVPAYTDLVGVDPAGNFLGNPGRGYWVTKDGAWHMADYDFEADYISSQNQTSGGYLIPAIKMLKAIKRIHFPSLESFPLEIIAAATIPAAVLARKLQASPVYFADLLLAFFRTGGQKLFEPLRIPGSKSAPVMIPPLTAVLLNQKFDEIANYIQGINFNASRAARVEAWRALIGDSFPVTAPT